jgi:hypothetical protein
VNESSRVAEKIAAEEKPAKPRPNPADKLTVEARRKGGIVSAAQQRRGSHGQFIGKGDIAYQP